MTRRPRSRKAELAQLRDQLRQQGWSYTQIAGHIQDEHGVNRRVAFRLAHGLTQAEVAERWNSHWPDAEAPKTAKHVSYWEAWPTPTGRMPSLDTLGKLACLYQCQPGDLLDGSDYGQLDLPATVATDSWPSVPAAAPVGSAISPAPTNALVPVQHQEHLPERLLPTSNDCFTPGLPQPPTDPFLTQLTHQLARLAAATDGDQSLSARQKDAAFKQLIDAFIAWAHTMNRRALLRHLSWAATTAAAAPLFDGLAEDQHARLAAVIQQPSRVDDEVVDHIEQVLWRCMRQDDSLGPQAALDTVLAQRNLAYAMLSECPSVLRPRLLSAFANLSRYAGWLAFDLKDFDGASYYYEQARTAAHEAQNTALGAMVLCNLSHLATWQHRPRVGIDHAVAAQAWANQTDDLPLRAFASDVAARAYAMDEQDAACGQHLHQAREYITAYEGGSTLVHFYNAELLDSIQGMCLLQLHQPAQAIQHTSQSLARIDRSYVRNIAFNTVYLGQAQLAARNVDGAADSLGDAAALAVHNHSARLVQHIQDLHTELTPWQDTRAVQQLDDRLRGYGLV